MAVTSFPSLQAGRMKEGEDSKVNLVNYCIDNPSLQYDICPSHSQGTYFSTQFFIFQWPTQNNQVAFLEVGRHTLPPKTHVQNSVLVHDLCTQTKFNAIDYTFTNRDTEHYFQEQNDSRDCHLILIPFLTLEPFPLLQKPKQSGHAEKNLMTIPAKVVPEFLNQ